MRAHTPAKRQRDPEGVKFHSPGRSPGLPNQHTLVALKGRYSRCRFCHHTCAPESRPFRAIGVPCRNTQGCALGYGITPLRGYGALRPFLCLSSEQFDL